MVLMVLIRNVGCNAGCCCADAESTSEGDSI